MGNKPNTENEILSVNNLTKTFKLSKKQQQLRNTKNATLTAVDDVSFKSYEGEVFGLLGPNGAGKTTVMRMLATLINPVSGDATVGGYSIIKQPHEVRRNIGFLTNELKLDDYFTPNYLYDYFSQLHGIAKEAADKRKQDLFARFGIDQFAEVKVANLSQGMKQKISLAVSIVHDPSIIIFDEPTNGLDVITSKVVTDFLVELKMQGKSVILSSHIFTLLEGLCDRVGIIINGQMVACDTIANIVGGKSLEDTFFDIYTATTKEVI
ncbi:MAG: ABC transporter ATP-binding protein [Lachnospiraceae bacterium]|jgi:sodium transport system ATP-binding protein|nr:ABC transporter ATP-binding protein [Lachnospiraceae bacterium]